MKPIEIPQIKFYESDHTYWNAVTNRRVPSVTEIIEHAGLSDSSWFTIEARDRGKALHKAIELWYECDLNNDSIDPIVKPYFDAFLSFVALSGIKIKRCEQIVYSKTFDFAGRFDLYGILNGKRAIIDVKTGVLPNWVGCQLMAYKFAWKEMGYGVDKTFSLTLKKDARFTLTEHSNARDFETFLTARKAMK